MALKVTPPVIMTFLGVFLAAMFGTFLLSPHTPGLLLRLLIGALLVFSFGFAILMFMRRSDDNTAAPISDLHLQVLIDAELQRQVAAEMGSPGWYADPEIQGAERWWDGTMWTERRSVN